MNGRKEAGEKEGRQGEKGEGNEVWRRAGAAGKPTLVSCLISASITSTTFIIHHCVG